MAGASRRAEPGRVRARWRALAWGSVLALILTLAGCGGSGREPDVYVALGDSFASGPGIAPQSTDGCARSGRNYAALLAETLSARVVHDVSCSGARLTDLDTAQFEGVRPQYDALGPETTLVTFGTIGGNDVDLVRLAGSCVLADCAGRRGDAVHRRISALEPELVHAIEEVQRRAPAADVVVVGYGHYLPATGCPALSGVTPAEARYVQGVIDHLSDVLSAAAKRRGVTFADMRMVPGAARHTACAAPEQQWLRGLQTYGDGFVMHPSSRGMSAWAARLRQVVERMREAPRG